MHVVLSVESIVEPSVEGTVVGKYNGSNSCYLSVETTVVGAVVLSVETTVVQLPLYFQWKVLLNS